MPPTNRILLLNFTQNEAHLISKAGYNVDRGIMGHFYESREQCMFAIPRPIYEYDILFYNSRLLQEQETLSEPFRNLYRNLFTEAGSFEALLSFKHLPRVRVVFAGFDNGIDRLVQGGIANVKTTRAEPNISSFVKFGRLSFTIEKIHDLIERLESQIESVGQFIVGRDDFPLNHVPVLGNRSSKEVAAYGTQYDGKKELRYMILPQLKDPAKATIDILNCLQEVSPGLFPDDPLVWLKGDEFLTNEEVRTKKEIDGIRAEAEKRVGEKQELLRDLSKKVEFAKKVLVATEDAKVEPQQRLSAVAKQALEFLGFTVIDIDAATKSAIKKEDYWVSDGPFLAITEVSGTVSKNPKIKEFNDILARMATIYKRKSELTLPEGSAISGLLVLNYDLASHPSKRPKLYTGDDEHIVQTAVEQSIGLLSTVELHRIVMGVMNGNLTKDRARALIKQPGRIECPKLGKTDKEQSPKAI